MANNEVKISIHIEMQGAECKISGTNLAHVNGNRLRVIERMLFRAVKKEKVTVTHQEKAAAQKDAEDAATKLAAQKAEEEAKAADAAGAEKDKKHKLKLSARIKANSSNN